MLALDHHSAAIRSALLLIAAAALVACSEEPPRHVWVAVARIAPPITPKWNSDEVIVTVRTTDGLLGYRSVPAARPACHGGDTVRATVRGIALSLDA